MAVCVICKKVYEPADSQANDQSAFCSDSCEWTYEQTFDSEWNY
jgi:hypothetical protein